MPARLFRRTLLLWVRLPVRHCWYFSPLLGSIHSVLRTLYSVLCALYTVLRTLHSVLCTQMYSGLAGVAWPVVCGTRVVPRRGDSKRTCVTAAVGRRRSSACLFRRKQLPEVSRQRVRQSKLLPLLLRRL